MNNNELKFLRQALNILHKYWGKDGELRFKLLLPVLNYEINSFNDKPENEVRLYISRFFKKLDWNEESINQWFNNTNSPFRKGINPEHNDYFKVLLAEFFLFKLKNELVSEGFSDSDAEHIVTAVFIASRASQ